MAEVLKHHKARKRFGQNFLNDDFWINKIAEAVIRRKVRRSSKSGRTGRPDERINCRRQAHLLR